MTFHDHLHDQLAKVRQAQAQLARLADLLIAAGDVAADVDAKIGDFWPSLRDNGAAAADVVTPLTPVVDEPDKPEIFVCGKCGTEYKSAGWLARHAETCDVMPDEDRFECLDCDDESYETVTALRLHTLADARPVTITGRTPPGRLMSWQASRYARNELETGGHTLTAGARLVLMLLAERANRHSGKAFGGDWLRTAAGMSAGNVRRVMWELAELGLIAVESDPPKVLVARFPLTAVLSTTRAVERGSDDDDDDARTTAQEPAQHGPHTRAARPAIPRKEVINRRRGRTCDSTCPLCDGAGWVEAEGVKRNGRTSTAVDVCPNRRAS